MRIARRLLAGLFVVLTSWGLPARGEPPTPSEAEGNSSTSPAVPVTVHQLGNAVYDATLMVPACHQLASRCATTTLLEGRGSLGPEKNAPNTLYNSCADGSNGTYRYSESIEEIRVVREDGTAFAEGKKVRVEVDLYVYDHSINRLDLFSAADATQPEWTYLTSVGAPANGIRTVAMEYTLPAGSLQALRASFRSGGTATKLPCNTVIYDDRDDVAFVVGQEVDSESPTVTLSAPAPGAMIRFAPSLEASADDNFGVRKVEFYAGSTLIDTDMQTPYRVWWDTTGIPNGPYTLTAKAYDEAGHVTTSEAVTVQVDNTLPSVSFSTPQNGAWLRGTVPLQVSASDNHQVTQVEFYVGSTLLDTVTAAPYATSLDTTALAAGSHTLTAIASDPAGNTASATLSVKVDNAAPTVTITSPAPGASIFLLTTVSANASDNQTVARVEFYDGSTLIGTDTSSPYSVSWSTMSVPKGSHTLTARAYDAVGHVTTSAGVTVQVK